MSFQPNHYELLGVSRNVDGNTLRKAFRTLSKTLHPDTTALPKDLAAEKFHEICEAYDLLSDPILRDAYDKSLNQVLESNGEVTRQPIAKNRDSTFTTRTTDVRRPLSGGELFSLLFLGLALFISLFLGIGFAIVQGRALNVQPSWLAFGEVSNENISQHTSDDTITTTEHAVKPAFFNGHRIVVGKSWSI